MKRIRYRVENKESETISYYVAAEVDEKRVSWSFSPHLPHEIDEKKGDEFGLGSFHDDTTQSYEDFKRSPCRPISKENYQRIIYWMEGVSDLEIIAREMPKREVYFNSVSLPSFAQMKNRVSPQSPISVKEVSDHDFIPSWQFVTRLEVSGESRLLYRCAEGGFMWVHVNQDGLAYKSSSVSDEEARELYRDHLLSFTVEEEEKLKAALQVGVSYKEGLNTALGVLRVMDSFFFPDAPCSEHAGSVMKLLCVDDGGLVRLSITEDGQIVAYRLIQGPEAWKIIQPVVDPSQTVDVLGPNCLWEGVGEE